MRAGASSDAVARRFAGAAARALALEQALFVCRQTSCGERAPAELCDSWCACALHALRCCNRFNARLARQHSLCRRAARARRRLLCLKQKRCRSTLFFEGGPWGPCGCCAQRERAACNRSMRSGAARLRAGGIALSSAWFAEEGGMCCFRLLHCAVRSAPVRWGARLQRDGEGRASHLQRALARPWTVRRFAGARRGDAGRTDCGRSRTTGGRGMQRAVWARDGGCGDRGAGRASAGGGAGRAMAEAGAGRAMAGGVFERVGPRPQGGSGPF